jgi:hypothetical protein
VSYCVGGVVRTYLVGLVQIPGLCDVQNETVEEMNEFEKYKLNKAKLSHGTPGN